MEVEVVPNNTCGHRILQTKPFLLINLEAAGGGVVAAANDRHQQQAYSGWCSPIQSIFAAESLTINDYKQLITQDGGLPCLYPTVEIRRMEGGQRQDGEAWGRTEEEDSRQIFLPSHNKLLWKGKVLSPKLSTLLILWLIFSVVLEGESTREMNKFEIL